jgi:hypothetical protein
MSKKGHPSAAPKTRSLRGLCFARDGVSENGHFLIPYESQNGEAEAENQCSGLTLIEAPPECLGLFTLLTLFLYEPKHHTPTVMAYRERSGTTMGTTMSISATRRTLSGR